MSLLARVWFGRPSQSSLATGEPLALPHSSLARRALALGAAILGFLWFLNLPYRRIFQLDSADVPALADGMLLLPGARWEDWITRGYSNFWDTYPEWPKHLTAFSRPVFQAFIYLAHFALGTDWPSYLIINYLAVAGVTAMAYLIGRAELGLWNAPALLAATLVLLSPPVLGFSIWDVGFAIECLAAIFVGAAFLASAAGRDLLCFSLLIVALATKENAVWAPFAAALTVVLRKGQGEAIGRRLIVGAAMLLPVVMWLGYRFACFGGIGGTYATLGYIPISGYLSVTAYKLIHVYRLLVTRSLVDAPGFLWLVDQAFTKVTGVLVSLLLLLWILRGAREAIDWVIRFGRSRQSPTVEPGFLVTLWAALGLAFHFALPLAEERYASAAVMFLWPAITAEVLRHRGRATRLALGVCIVIATIRTADWSSNMIVPPAGPRPTLYHEMAAMNAALRELPARVEQVYVVSAGGLVETNPAYLRALLGVPAEIIRVVDIDWKCPAGDDVVAFRHDDVGEVVVLRAALPGCASFEFFRAAFDRISLIGTTIRRGDSILYEAPDAHPIEAEDNDQPPLTLGSTITMTVRPKGPARFIIEHGRPGALAWFDVP